jgi:IS30 family transposase
MVRIEHIKKKWAKEVHTATLRALRRTRVASLTNDNGLEFASFKKTSKELKAPIFFTRPYASWERGSIENMNGLIRQYFPKKENLNEITKADLRRVQQLLNERPRKTLGFLSPAEIQKSA